MAAAYSNNPECLVVDDLEVDQPTSAKDFSHGDDGTWVRAWIHVSNAELTEELTDNA